MFTLIFKTEAQNSYTKIFLDSLIKIDNNQFYSPDQKLGAFYILKKSFDDSKLSYDSAYSVILLKIVSLETSVNRNFQTSIKLLNTSIRINLSGQSGSSKYLAAKSYFILAMNYYQLSLFSRALNYFDSTIIVANTFPDTTIYVLYSRLYKAFLFNQNGDYQKSVEESTIGIDYSIKKKDSLLYSSFLIQRAQSLHFENRFNEAIKDLDIIIVQSKSKKQLSELASALKNKALILEKKDSILSANKLFKQSLTYRIQTNLYQQIALDYIDYGNFFLNTLKDYKKAEWCYNQTIFYAKKISDSITLSKANANLEEVFFNQGKYVVAKTYFFKALNYLNINSNNDLFNNPTVAQLNSIAGKELIVTLMTNKIGLILKLYSLYSNKALLNTCIKTSLIIDSLITKMRNDQFGTSSKLFWRNYTRDFYNSAIEVSYLANKSELTLFFMEKSRAVLLNDKLNELDASSYLSNTDAAKQENYEIKIIELQQQLASLSENLKQYQTLELKLINTKNEAEKFIKSLEQKYPAYYQYKYEDEVPTLAQVQSFLKKNNQSFIHYFTGDTTTYILAITPTQTKFIRLSQKEFDKEKLSRFLQFCANKQALNNNYNSFAELSNSIYASLFKQLQLPEGRVVICMDNTIIPFEALCTDAKGKHFLLNDYSFDYAYSARFLMKQFNNPPAKGNFAGFAPVSFAKHLGVVDLKNAAAALNTSAAYYGNDKLFTYQNASRTNFFNYASSYSVVSIFSHAYADTTDNEPVLFMCDSLIHLSELQKLDDPATRLVLLSACQTNVGKNATGEGIYSLARGFATAGIPSVAATLWKADEQMIYAISEKLNEYLAEGMNKDEALQKAKLYFVQNSNSEKMLPYYWANMILIGNTDAIQFKAQHHHNYLWWAGTGMIAIASTIMFIRRRKL